VRKLREGYCKPVLESYFNYSYILNECKNSRVRIAKPSNIKSFLDAL